MDAEMSIDAVDDDPEVLLALSDAPEGIHLAVMPRDENPNQDSLAVVLAGFINANLPALVKAAMQAKRQHEASEIARIQPRSVTTLEGGLAQKGVTLLGADGKPAK